MRLLARLLVPLLLVALLLPAHAPLVLAAETSCGYDPYDPGCQDQPKQDITSRTRVMVNGHECHVDKVILFRQRTYLPLRAFSECLGMSVNWIPQGTNGYTSAAIITGAPSTLGQAFDAYFQPVAESPTVRVVYSDNTETRFQLDGWPFIMDGRTYVPFRFVTDLVNAKTSWISASEDHPWNEVQVDLQTVALPVDQWQEATRYVGYTNTQGFFLLDGGSSGYTIYPSTLRNISYSLELYNAILKEKGESGVELDFNGFRVRTNTEYGPIDYYGAVTVRWFTDDETYQQYKNRVERQQRYVKGGTFVAGGAITLIFGAAVGIWEGIGSATGLGIGTWHFFMEDWTADLVACSSRADLEKYKSKRPANSPAIWGIANTPNGELCVPYYSESPLEIMVKP